LLSKTVLAAPVLLALAGCVSAAGGKSDIDFDIERSAPAYVTIAGAEQTASETVIHGEAALPMSDRTGGFTGGVEASIYEPGRPPLVFRDVKVVPRPRPKVLGGEAYFIIHTGHLLAPGTTVKLVYRNG